MSWSPAPVASKGYFSRKAQKERSINGCTSIPVEIHHDHLDNLAVLMRRFRHVLGGLPSLFKALVGFLLLGFWAPVGILLLGFWALLAIVSRLMLMQRSEGCH